ncbi:helix-turn-helix domain-containing protein [Lutibacter sp. TH_r2]|uniref:helix-turn-helix domain-containing protein n=1 Tax=Lutibacter sp. TH_r2 TaxID=3082083 RepID=UPI00295532E4|nr:helix-turn-helix domain-containing protein [Lutibacter sp. TH_r2]MDV7187632.1 helix-turn-helix domain-containing protein [Lutibacter sp. TH_r2]
MKDFKDLYLLSVRHIKEIENRLEIITKEFDKSKIDNQIRLLDNADVKQLFKISDKTLTNWKNEGILNPSKIGGTIYYELDDIKNTVQQNKVGLKKKVS